MRLLFPIMLFCFIILQNRIKKIDFYKISIVLYFIFLSLRFMQGTDYAQYMRCYDLERPLYEVFSNGFINSQFELLYNVLVSTFKMFSIPFPVFIGIINLINLILINKFLKTFSSNKLESLLLLYLLYGTVFLESTIRQSLALSFILGLSLGAFYRRDFKTLIISSIIAFLFHRSSIIISLLLILLFILYEKFSEQEIYRIVIRNRKKIILFVMILFFFINIFPFELICPYLPSVLGQKLLYYISNYSISLFPVMLRSIYLILFIYIIYTGNISILNRKNILYLLYSVGIVLYFIFVKFSILSRITIYFEILEIVIFLDLFKDIKKKVTIKNIFTISYCCISLLLFFKDGIDTQIQSNYEKTYIIYPYYSYFNEEEARSNIKNVID